MRDPIVIIGLDSDAGVEQFNLIIREIPHAQTNIRFQGGRATAHVHAQDLRCVPITVPIMLLSDQTKEYLIAHAVSGKTPGELILGLLEREAAEAGFPSKPEEVKP